MSASADPVKQLTEEDLTEHQIQVVIKPYPVRKFMINTRNIFRTSMKFHFWRNIL